jgi:hypothetical protein
MSGPYGLWLSPRQGRRVIENRRSPPMPAPAEDPSLSPYDRMMQHRRRILARDWILALIALGLVIAASCLHRDRAPSDQTPPMASAPSAR